MSNKSNNSNLKSQVTTNYHCNSQKKGKTALNNNIPPKVEKTFLKPAKTCKKQPCSPTINNTPNTSPIIATPKPIHDYTITLDITKPHTVLDLIELALCTWHALPSKEEAPETPSPEKNPMFQEILIKEFSQEKEAPKQAPLSKHQTLETYHYLLAALDLAKNTEKDKQYVLTVLKNFLAELSNNRLNILSNNTPLRHNLVAYLTYYSFIIISHNKTTPNDSKICFIHCLHRKHNQPPSEQQILKTYHYLLAALDSSKNTEKDKQYVLTVLKNFLAELPIDHLRTLIKNTPLDHYLGIFLTFYIFTIILEHKNCNENDSQSKMGFLRCLTPKQIITIYQNNAFPTLIQGSHFDDVIRQSESLNNNYSFTNYLCSTTTRDFLQHPGFSIPKSLDAMNVLKNCYYSIQDPLNITNYRTSTRQPLSLEQIKQISCKTASVTSFLSNLYKNIDTYQQNEMTSLLAELALLTLFQTEIKARVILDIIHQTEIDNNNVNLTKIKKIVDAKISNQRKDLDDHINLLLTLCLEVATYPNGGFYLALYLILSLLQADILKKFLFAKFHFSVDQLNQLYNYYALLYAS